MAGEQPNALADECSCQQLKLSLLSLQLQLSSGALEQGCLEPCPAEIIFRHCVPYEVYDAPLVLRNTGTVSAARRRVKPCSLQGAGNVPLLGTVPLTVASCWWHLSQRSFSGQYPCHWKPWADGMLRAL